MTPAVIKLIPSLEQHITSITVDCKRRMKDIYTMPPEAQTEFADAVAQELQRGQHLGRLVLDLIVNHKKLEE